MSVHPVLVFVAIHSLLNSNCIIFSTLLNICVFCFFIKYRKTSFNWNSRLTGLIFGREESVCHAFVKKYELNLLDVVKHQFSMYILYTYTYYALQENVIDMTLTRRRE